MHACTRFQSCSVAVNSMAGWLIGLGDRHSSNILLDTRTAACVHIDLGVAFEQVCCNNLCMKVV